MALGALAVPGVAVAKSQSFGERLGAELRELYSKCKPGGNINFDNRHISLSTPLHHWDDYPRYVSMEMK